LYGKCKGVTRKDGERPALFPRKEAEFYSDYSKVNFKHDDSEF